MLPVFLNSLQMSSNAGSSVTTKLKWLEHKPQEMVTSSIVESVEDHESGLDLLQARLQTMLGVSVYATR